MISTIFLTLLIFTTTAISVIAVGEMVAMSYPESKYTRWWRKHVVENESN